MKLLVDLATGDVAGERETNDDSAGISKKCKRTPTGFVFDSKPFIS
jgi:hypothetical protein